jgi:dTDP-4-dehydrorhamnose 3,5-epimerase
MAQGKLVRVVQGAVWDVAVDLRPDAPTYGKWVAAELSDENRQLLYIPPWCAHGFCVLTETAHVIYKVTEEYSPEHEGGIAWDSPALAIDWPEKKPALSDRDRNWQAF